MVQNQHFSATEFIQNFTQSKNTEEMGFVLSRAFEQVREELDTKQEIAKLKEILVTKEYLDDKLQHFASKEYVHIEINKAKWQTIGTILVVFIIPIIARHFGFNI